MLYYIWYCDREQKEQRRETEGDVFFMSVCCANEYLFCLHQSKYIFLYHMYVLINYELV